MSFGRAGSNPVGSTVGVAQSDRAPGCDPGCRGFESRHPPQLGIVRLDIEFSESCKQTLVARFCARIVANAAGVNDLIFLSHMDCRGDLYQHRMM